MSITNVTNVPLSLLPWLLIDDYDHNPDPMTISATTLLKPIRSVILSQRMPQSENTDVSNQIASSIGTAVHNDIERSWKSDKLKAALMSLGYPEKITDAIMINPPDGMVLPNGAIPIFMEQRQYRKLGDYTISGKYDIVLEGAVRDYKTTKAYTWMKQTNTDSYRQQGSIYRWLNPGIIIDDHMYIDYIFTDWTAVKAMQDKQFPQSQILSQRLPLMSLPETESFIAQKLRELTGYWDKPQEDLPLCSPEELWQRPTVFKYFKNPAKMARSTKNFTNFAEAQQRKIDDGNVGKIATIPGEVKRCLYCDAVTTCTQASRLVSEGLLKI